MLVCDVLFIIKVSPYSETPYLSYQVHNIGDEDGENHVGVANKLKLKC